MILFVGLGLDKVMSYYTSQENITTEKSLLRGSFYYIASLIKENKQSVTAFWTKNHKTIQEELGYPLAMFQLNDFSKQERLITSLKTGQTIVMSAENNGFMYYRQLQNTDYIIAIGPLHHQSESFVPDGVIIALYYFLVAAALFLWLSPLSHDLHELRKAAINFGDEDFKTQVKLRRNSSIAPVADAFNFMTQRIQELVIAHKELTHAVSHELKTPLARFKFSLEIIDSNNDAKQRNQYIQAMKEDVRELDDLIDEMLRYAKLSTENLTLHLETVDAKQWMQTILAQYKQSTINISFDFLTESPDEVNEIVIDPHLMNRAINNLIRNGLRHAKKQIKVTLEMTDQHINLSIDDDGDGIPKQFLEHVFQPFTRLDASRDKQSGGYGLGLAITQKIVLQHGGIIYADKSTLGGARFYLSWPII